ncbi:hypothetical protein [Alteribacillus sp. YIM 98480]|uniref:hypothetical protein n=1 Tax=Alteribacillus sp. YIM 98480 TaxID=2606599 RepID=UPI00131DF7C5|nr:hypothetical protein [Alteribacillus sp. YIM 98480]
MLPLLFLKVRNYKFLAFYMSSSSAYSLDVPSVRQWKAKISFPYAAPPGLVACEQGAYAFLRQGRTRCM